MFSSSYLLLFLAQGLCRHHRNVAVKWRRPQEINVAGDSAEATSPGQEVASGRWRAVEEGISRGAAQGARKDRGRCESACYQHVAWWLFEKLASQAAEQCAAQLAAAVPAERQQLRAYLADGRIQAIAAFTL